MIRISLFAALGFGMIAMVSQVSHARVGARGVLAQLTDTEKKWLGNQSVPTEDGSGTYNCCSVADGVFAVEEFRGDEIWVSFVARWTYGYNQEFTGEYAVDWMQVPERTIIKVRPGDNAPPQPIVWWQAQWEDSSAGKLKFDEKTGKAMITIRCYKRGTEF